MVERPDLRASIKSAMPDLRGKIRAEKAEKSEVCIYWLLHDIVITTIVWCMAYKRRVERGSFTARQLCNSIATGWAIQMGGRNKRRFDSCTNDSKYKNIL